MTTNVNDLDKGFFFTDLYLTTKYTTNYIMEEILDINGKSKAKLLPEYSEEFKMIEDLVNQQLKDEEYKRLNKEKFSILQKSLKKIIIQKLEIDSKTIYLVEGTTIFYYDDIFTNHLIKENKEIPVIDHSARLTLKCNLNGNQVLIIHKSALKDLLVMNISDFAKVFDKTDISDIGLCDDFFELPIMEQYIILHGFDIKCIEIITKFINNKLDLATLYNNYPVYYYFYMTTPYYISARAFYERECCITDCTTDDNIFDLILSIMLRMELIDFVNNLRNIGSPEYENSIERLHSRLEEVFKGDALTVMHLLDLVNFHGKKI